MKNKTYKTQRIFFMSSYLWQANSSYIVREVIHVFSFYDNLLCAYIILLFRFIHLKCYPKRIFIRNVRNQLNVNGVSTQKKNTKLYTKLEVFCLHGNDGRHAKMSAWCQNNMCIHSLQTISYLIKMIKYFESSK